MSSVLHGEPVSSLKNLDLNARKAEIEANKGEIEISPIRITSATEVNLQAEQAVDMEVVVRNLGAETRQLAQIGIIESCPGTFKNIQTYIGPLKPNTQVIIKFRCTPEFIGTYRGIFCFEFTSEIMQFAIGRYAKINYGDKVLEAALKPSAPFVKKKRTYKRTDRNNIIAGEPPESNGLNPYPRKLYGYDIKAAARNVFYNLNETKDYLQNTVDQLVRLAELSGAVDMSLYGKLYEALLNMEELQLNDDIHQFDLDKVPLKKHGAYLSLEVAGLAEKRPSVVVGDKIHAYKSNDASEIKYEGYVHSIEQNNVLLKFHNSFHKQHQNGGLFDVEFTVNRRTWRQLYQAVELSTKPRNPTPKEIPENVPYSITKAKKRAQNEKIELCTFLFPVEFEDKWDDGEVELFESEVHQTVVNKYNALPYSQSLNEQQQNAVKYILAGQGNKAPYIIFGPPGTGKTVTVVETVKQFFRLPQNSNKKILLCAPSNTAADLLVERLATEFSSTQMFRMMSFMRNKNEVTAAVKAYTFQSFHAEGFEVPAMSELRQFKVVVSTCMMAAKLYNQGIPEGHFDIVIVDESGHAWEPEVLSTFVTSLDQYKGQLVLAGDPKQLGPITHNKLADAMGLGLSLLERLILRPLYSRNIADFPNTNGYNPLHITKLVNCYRCHPEIIRLPNALFYDGDLRPVAHESVSHNLCQWSQLPKRGFPLIFHGIEGECIQESTSPSWFNPNEVEQTLKYVKSLMSTAGVKAAEIGVITPYARQVKKIKLALSLSRIEGVIVGSCEQLQGQERRVIIITTVRSSDDYSSYDIKYNLGFVSNPKRFNVAVTRAQALLIVIGNPKVLSSDNNWNMLLNHCRSNGAYVGVPFTPPVADTTTGMSGLPNVSNGHSSSQSAGVAHNSSSAVGDAAMENMIRMLNKMMINPDNAGAGDDAADDGDDYDFVDLQE